MVVLVRGTRFFPLFSPDRDDDSLHTRVSRGRKKENRPSLAPIFPSLDETRRKQRGKQETNSRVRAGSKKKRGAYRAIGREKELAAWKLAFIFAATERLKR